MKRERERGGGKRLDEVMVLDANNDFDGMDVMVWYDTIVMLAMTVGL